MFIDKKNNEYKELLEFLQSNNKSHYLQTTEWAQVKNNWKNEMLIVKNNEKIIGVMSVLLKKLPLLNSYMMYAPRGFVCNPDDKEALEKLTKEVKKIAKKYNAFVFKMDPDIPDDNDAFQDMMKSLGYKYKANGKTIQPQFVYRLNIKDKTEEELLKLFKAKTRYNINLAIRKSVKIREGQRRDIPVFYDILKYTAKRDNFCVRDMEYYEKIFDYMGAEHAKIFIAECENVPVAVAMSIFYGNKVWYLYGGSLDKYRNYMPTYLLQWEMIKWAINTKCDVYDFGGVSGYKSENDPMYGVYRFKKGFNGEIIKFTDELYIDFKPHINNIWNILSGCFFKCKEIKSMIK